MQSFEQEIARLAGRLDTAGPRLRGLFANLNAALSRFAAARDAGVASEERRLLLAFEELLNEALNTTAALLNDRGDSGGARECVELVATVRGVVQNVIEGE